MGSLLNSKHRVTRSIVLHFKPGFRSKGTIATTFCKDSGHHRGSLVAERKRESFAMLVCFNDQ
jgi:hypothetical protein